MTKIEDVWKVRIEWWSQPMNKRFVEYALAGWINPSTLSYIEAPSNPTASKIVGTGQLRFIDARHHSLLSERCFDNGSSALFQRDLDPSHNSTDGRHSFAGMKASTTSRNQPPIDNEA